MIAPMPCSRTPKWMLRPPQLPAATLLKRLDWDMERLEAGPAESLLRELHLLGAERRAVGLGRVLPVRAAVGDVGAHDHERRPVGDASRGGERGVQRAQVVAV